MKSFQLLVQKKEVNNIPAPASEQVACAATAAAPPLPPPLVWLHEKFDYLRRCSASTISVCFPSYPPTWSAISGTTNSNPTCSTCFSALLFLCSERQQQNNASKRNNLESMQPLLDLNVDVTQQSMVK